MNTTNRKITQSIQVTGLQLAPAQRLPMKSVDSMTLESELGIIGDRYHGTHRRQVTVITLDEIRRAAENFGAPIDPVLTRRNITLDCGWLPRTRGSQLFIGEVEL